MNDLKFRDKVAVISGSSRGIGKGIAKELAKRGAIVVLNGRNESRLNEAGNELRQIHGQVLCVPCDVSTTEGGEYLIEEAYKKFGRIDFLINNAGVSMRGNFADLNPGVVRTVFESNVFSAANLTIPALKYLRISHGSIVFISSLVGIRGLPGLSVYCSSKMALRALAESLRIEEVDSGLHIGLVYVPLAENDADKITIGADGSEVLLKPRIGKGYFTIEEVAKAVINNISSRKFITVLSWLGKMNYFLQPRFPSFVEFIIKRNRKKFEDGSK